MKIRLGHILLILILAGIVYAGWLPVPARLKTLALDAWSEIHSLIGLVKSGEEAEARPSSAAHPPVSASTAPVRDNPVVATSTPPAKAAAPAKAAPVRKKIRSRRKRVRKKRSVKRRKKTVKKKRATVKKAAPADRYSSFKGAYVEMSLKSGSSVKGVYLGRSGTNIKLDIPGLGPFDYPAGDVTGMKIAE